jgi:hypothetical protein
MNKIFIEQFKRHFSSFCISEPPKKRIKIAPLNFEDCRVVDHAKIPQNVVQINVDESEVGRRIRDFIERKREEIDRNNVRDFTVKKGDGCARIESVIFRVKDSKGHLKGLKNSIL